MRILSRISNRMITLLRNIIDLFMNDHRIEISVPVICGFLLVLIYGSVFGIFKN